MFRLVKKFVVAGAVVASGLTVAAPEANAQWGMSFYTGGMPSCGYGYAVPNYGGYYNYSPGYYGSYYRSPYMGNYYGGFGGYGGSYYHGHHHHHHCR